MNRTGPDRLKGEMGEQEARSRLERALVGAQGNQHAGVHDLGVDLTMQFRAPGDDRMPLHFGVQVKTGPSFTVDARHRWTVRGVSADHFRRWSRSRMPVVFVWIRPTKPVECYWAVVRKGTSLEHFSISKKAIVSPGIATLLAVEYLNEFRPTGRLAGSRLRPPLSRGIRQHAKEYYWKALLGETIKHPLLGEIQFTQAAWRHLTRRRRSQSQIHASLELLPIAAEAVEQLHELVGLRYLPTVARGEWKTERRLLAFKHRGVLLDGRPPGDLTIVLREQVTYPRDWATSVTLHQEVSRHLVFYSIYEKPEL